MLAQEADASAEDRSSEHVPCLVMDDGDDAAAIEASLTENIARLPMDEIDQYRAFSAIKVEGLSVADIAVRFGVTERLVEQRLAIARIIAPISKAYRKGDIQPKDSAPPHHGGNPVSRRIGARSIRATTAMPQPGGALRDWLFGGAQLPLSNALFALAFDPRCRAHSAAPCSIPSPWRYSGGALSIATGRARD